MEYEVYYMGEVGNSYIFAYKGRTHYVPKGIFFHPTWEARLRPYVQSWSV